jgi:crotonobetainyl-CoA:carnitine CoA-transferase CaiB-like acyl-CoA transferase
VNGPTKLRDLFNRPLDGALSGYRVLDYTTAWAGTRMAAYLAEMGAEVIHVESLQYLDTHRAWSKWGAGAFGLFPGDTPGSKPWERNFQYNEFGKNKLGITLDLADPRGVALFKDLAAISDVVVDNYKAGAVAKFGVGYDELRKRRPDIICVSCPAFGTTGPYKDFVAWGNQVSALTGHGLLLNYEDGDTPEAGATYADPIAAISGAFSIVAALIHRRKTGEGQYIEMPLAEVMPGLIPEAILDYVLNGRVARPLGNRNPAAAPWGVYPCKGADQWVAICCQDDVDFAALTGVIGRPELLSDPRFSTLEARIQNHKAIDAIVAGWTAGRGKFEAADEMQEAGVAAEPANSKPEVIADPQLTAREFFTELPHPEAGTFKYPLEPSRLSKTPAAAYRAAPLYGEHNAEVLGGYLGLTAAELAELERDDVIGNEPWEDAARANRGRSGGA